jgi:hypothetical protein
VDPAAWETFVVTISRQAPQLLKNAFQVIANKVVKNKLALFLIAASIAIQAIASGLNTESNPVGKYNIPASGLGTPFSNQEKCNGPTKKSVDSVGSAVLSHPSTLD